MTAHLLSGAPVEARTSHGSLDVFLHPATVAVFGATEAPGSLGRAVMENLIWNPFGGTIFPLTRHSPGVLGVKAYAGLADVPMPVELALLAIPAPFLADALEECAAAGVRGAIILSEGFRKGDPIWTELEERVRPLMEQAGLRILGPHSVGVACSSSGFQATVAAGRVMPGTVGFVSQFGSLLTGLVSGGLGRRVGCSTFLSVGGLFDVDWADCLEYLADDPHTELIALYMESLGDPAAFFAAARRVTPYKPVIVVRGGRAATDRMASVRGALAPREHILEEAFRRAGILRVDTLAELFRMIEMLQTQPPPRGKRLAILTNAGGPAVGAIDALLEEGGDLAELSLETVARLKQVLPHPWSHHNPVDVGRDVEPGAFVRAAGILAEDPRSDGLLVILTPQAGLDPVEMARALIPLAQRHARPILACWLWGAATPTSLRMLEEGGIPTFSCPNAAIRAFGQLYRHGGSVRDLTEEQSQGEECDDLVVGAASSSLVSSVRCSGRLALNEAECRQLFAAYGLPPLASDVAASATEAVELTNAIGYPVLLRPAFEENESPDLAGVRIRVADADAVRRSYATLRLLVNFQAYPVPFPGVGVVALPRPGEYELALRSMLDPHLGPVIQLAPAGALGAQADRLVALPPLNSTLVRQLIEQSLLYAAVGAPCASEWVDLLALQQLLVRFSDLVLGEPGLKELRLEPILASPERLVVVGAHAVLHEPEVTEEQLPRPVFFSGPHARGLRGPTCVFRRTPPTSTTTSRT